MSVFEKKVPAPNLTPVLEVFQWDTYPFMLVGTGGLKLMKYPADVDGLVKVLTYTPKSAYDNTKKIIDRIAKQPNLFFAELKLQNKDGEKVKFFSPEEFSREAFYKFFDPETIDYIKFDCVIDLSGHFKEVSCIFFLSKDPLDMKKYQRTLFDDGVHYYESGKPFKYLKRLFMANKLKGFPDNKLLNSIADFFNGPIGKLYAIQNELDAAYIFHKKYQKPFDNMRIERFLSGVKLSGLPFEEIPLVSAQYNDLIQSEAKQFINKIRENPQQAQKQLEFSPVVETEDQHAVGGNILNTYRRKRGGAGGLGDFIGKVLTSTEQERDNAIQDIFSKISTHLEKKRLRQR